MTTPEEGIVRPYGDRLGDGAIQLSFTLPMPCSATAREAAICLAQHLGLRDVNVAAAEAAGQDYTYFVVYGRTDLFVDTSALVVSEVEASERSMQEVDALVAEAFGRKLVVLGACLGEDAHTVGIDAILNMKGYAGDYGLERYAGFDVHNMGGQVSIDELVERAQQVRADAVLISKVVTQRGVHKRDAAELVARRCDLPQQALLILGGPRVDHKLALELGFDAGFGRGTRPSQVANYIVDELVRRSRAAGEG